MTSLDDFRRVLNANPDYTDTLLILADWCDEHGEPYGEGYRVLGLLGKTVWWACVDECWCFWSETKMASTVSPMVQLPDDWLGKFEPSRHVILGNGYVVYTQPHKMKDNGPFVLFKAAAKAFCSLPAERRVEFLAGAAQISSS